MNRIDVQNLLHNHLIMLQLPFRSRKHDSSNHSMYGIQDPVKLNQVMLNPTMHTNQITSSLVPHIIQDREETAQSLKSLHAAKSTQSFFLSSSNELGNIENVTNIDSCDSNPAKKRKLLRDHYLRASKHDEEANISPCIDKSNLNKHDASCVIPPSSIGLVFYEDNDVLCGRGGGTNIHCGNRYFRELIHIYRSSYLCARKNDKPEISRMIVNTIRKRKGRFLKVDTSSGLWFEIGNNAAREKTSQALRQRASDYRKILLHQKTPFDPPSIQEPLSPSFTHLHETHTKSHSFEHKMPSIEEAKLLLYPAASMVTSQKRSFPESNNKSLSENTMPSLIASDL
mmetsp:Transcript_13941/g.16413  ORF Transcript_13941/g.16413 Transcript_13941/m.16413 type:complete len:341 (+) Transcript_13941:54-1076(+)